jgi:hypothetical protein
VVPAFAADPDRVQALSLATGCSRTIVVDDASIVPFPPLTGIEVIRLESNSGPGAARQAGLEQVSTPFVAFLDTDITVDDGWITALLPFFADDKVALVRNTRHLGIPSLVRAGTLCLDAGAAASAGGCGDAAGFEMRAGTVVVGGEVGSQPGLGLRRGSVISLTDSPRPAAMFQPGSAWRPPFLHLLCRSLAAAGFAPAESIHPGNGRQWHGDMLAGGRGELLHPV